MPPPREAGSASPSTTEDVERAKVIEEDGCFAVVTAGDDLYVTERLHGRRCSPLMLRITDRELSTARACIDQRRGTHDQTYHQEDTT